jgi:hypothetical protein
MGWTASSAAKTTTDGGAPIERGVVCLFAFLNNPILSIHCTPTKSPWRLWDMRKPKTGSCVVAPAPVRIRVSALIDERGALGAARLLGLARDTTLALAAGARVHVGTSAYAEARLKQLAERPPTRKNRGQ